MHIKRACLASALTLSHITAANSQETWFFHPYVSLGSHCQGSLTDMRLAGVPVPLASAQADCPELAGPEARSDDRPRKLVFDAGTGRIIATRPYK
jgi:hypothetical protein